MAGKRTHLESIHVLMDQLDYGNIDYLKENLSDAKCFDAFRSGVTFPDWAWYEGSIHDAGEESHWKDFLNAYFEGINDGSYCSSFTNFEKDLKDVYICFGLGILLHGIVDEYWHFDIGKYSNFLSHSLEKDGASHSECEASCDIFLFQDKGDISWEFWLPFLHILRIFRKLGFTYIRETHLKGGINYIKSDLKQLNDKASDIKNIDLKDKYPWTYNNFMDTPYGGVSMGVEQAIPMMKRYISRIK